MQPGTAFVQHRHCWPPLDGLVQYPFSLLELFQALQGNVQTEVTPEILRIDCHRFLAVRYGISPPLAANVQHAAIGFAHVLHAFGF